MSDQPIGTVLQYALDAPDLPTLLRNLADSIEALGADADIQDVVIRPAERAADVYFLRK